MKLSKSSISCLLVCCMVFALLPVVSPARAAEDSIEMYTSISNTAILTVKEVAKLVEDYYNRHYQNEANPGTYVVFSDEAYLDGSIYTMPVRFQRSNSSPMSTSNILVDFVSVDMRTGVMSADNITVQLFDVSAEETTAAFDDIEDPFPSLTTDHEIQTIHALEALLSGVPYYPEYYGNDVQKWSDATICNAIYGKLLWEFFSNPEASYLKELGLTYWSNNDGYLHFDLELIRKITQDTLGRDFPTNTHSEHIAVSGNELIIMPALGESTFLSIQDFTELDNKIIAVGTAVHKYSAYNEFLGYFQAVFEKNPASIYGYTLLSLSRIEGNQDFKKLTASASSELTEALGHHPASNVLDGELTTAWVEGVDGLGINEWLKISTRDGAKMQISAIKFFMGYHKNDQLLEKNGWPHKILIECEGGYQQIANFYSYTDIVVLDFSADTSWIKITILDAKEGYKYDDICISEIQLYGIDTTAFFSRLSLDPSPEEGPSDPAWTEPQTDHPESTECSEPAATDDDNLQNKSDIPANAERNTDWIHIVYVGIIILLAAWVIILKTKSRK